MHRSIHRAPLSLVLAATLAAAGCGGDGDSGVDIPTGPSTPVVTETFAGTLTPNGGATHPFSVTQRSTLTATLTALAPDESAVIGLSLGTWNGSVCQIVLANDNASRNDVVVGASSSSGDLCVRVYDVGRLVEPTSYEVQVMHQ